MKRICTLAMILVAQQASAASLLLEMRGDLDSAQYNAEAAAALTKTDTSFFTMQTGRLDFKGDMNESLSYRMRLRFNAEETVKGYDSLSSRVDYASLTHKMEAFSLTFGKFGSDVGGFETIGDSMNMYFGSQANVALTKGLSSALTPAVKTFQPMKYATGVKATTKLGDSEVSLMAFNNPDGDALASPKAQSRLFTGAVFKGKFMDAQLQPVLSYHTGGYNRDQADITGAGSAQIAAAGLKWNQETWWIQADYIDLKSPEFNAADPSTAKVQSTVGEFGYKMDAWTAKAKIEASDLKETAASNAEKKFKVEGAGLALEYKPFDDKNMRYHAAYTQQTTKTLSTANAKDAIEQHVIVGLAFSTDLLK